MKRKKTKKKIIGIKAESPHELIMLYMIGFKPKDIINFGYGKQTVYNYKGRYERSLEKLRTKILSKVQKSDTIKKVANNKDTIEVY